jgi:adenylate cyclase class 2
MQTLETEVKICVHDRAALEGNLLQAGFRLVTPSTFERNTLYDTPGRTLRAQHQILRVRQYGNRWIVTHKGMPGPEVPQEQHKHRIETETAVEDGAAMAAIFTTLGFAPAFIYEKWRTEYADATGHCVIDETPIGLFAELEGPAQWIDATLAKFSVHSSDVMTLSYGRLFENWKVETGSAANNLTFDEIPNTNNAGAPKKDW